MDDTLAKGELSGLKYVPHKCNNTRIASGNEIIILDFMFQTMTRGGTPSE